MDRLQELEKMFSEIDDDKSETVKPLLYEIVFMETRLQELRQLPHIRIHPTDKSRQEITAAGKQYKEIMQAYLSAIKVLLTALYRNNNDGANELLEKLKEFEL